MNINKTFLIPSFLADNKIAITIHKYLLNLGPSSGFYSTILYKQNQRYYFLDKDKDFPYIPFDWTLYTFMRTRARTVILSGLVLRREPWLVDESRGTFGKKQLQEIYEENVHEPINLIVFTKKMDKQQIKSMVQEKYFSYIPTNQLFQNQQINNISFKSVAEQVNKRKMGPAIYQNGYSTLSQGLKQVGQHQQNFCQLIVFSMFEGKMPKKYVKEQYKFDSILRDFQHAWSSQEIKSIVRQGDKQEPISLKFIVYVRKNKSKVQ